ncbi:MAG: hypothetical protein EPN22_15270 [Nitrospirae bacterium]|nr:MAG: hypothetical protein EPN22_15270 [Nitrospirota bacterium]
MDLRDISIKWKIAIPVIIAVTVGIVLTILVTGNRTESIVVDEAKQGTMVGYRDTVLNSLTTMMYTSSYSSAKDMFLDQMKNVADLKVIKTEAIDKDFGKGDARDYAADALEKEVIEKGTEKFVLKGSHLRGVFPYTAKSDFMGKNCLSCHKVNEGTVLGAISISVPLTESFRRIRLIQYLYLGLGLGGVLSVTFVVTIIVSIILKPMSVLVERMKELSGEDIESVSDVKVKDEIKILNVQFDNMVTAIETRNNRIKEQMEELTALFNVGEILNRSDSVDEAVGLILHAVNIGFHVEECAVILLDESGGLNLKKSIGLSDAKAEAVKDVVDTSDIRNRIMQGELFIANNIEKGVGDFLVVPLKSAKTPVGVITLHKVKGTEIGSISDMEEIKRLFSIIAMQMSPYLMVGISKDKKRNIVNPFTCYMDIIKGHIDAVSEYSGAVSLAVVKIENYNSLCKDLGMDNASLKVQKAGDAISSSINNVHDVVRITEIKLVVLLPMVEKMDATDIINSAVAAVEPDVMVKTKVVSYPEDGETPAQLMFLSYV